MCVGSQNSECREHGQRRFSVQHQESGQVRTGFSEMALSRKSTGSSEDLCSEGSPVATD